MRQRVRFISVLVFLGWMSISQTYALSVVTSIKPIHSLVAAVMDGVGEPELLIQGSESPHHYALRPSEAKMLQRANLIFWIGPSMEIFLVKPLSSLARKGASVELMDAPGVRHLGYREWKSALEKNGQQELHIDHVSQHDHSNSTEDPHIWLDPLNAKALVEFIAQLLAAQDIANEAVYVANATEILKRLDDLTERTRKRLEQVNEGRFIVFHDGYRYFEERFGLQAVGAITLLPESKPGAQHVRMISKEMVKTDTQCVFSEPQFTSSLVDMIASSTGANIGELDPLGASIKSGPHLYEQLIEQMADRFVECLSVRNIAVP